MQALGFSMYAQLRKFPPMLLKIISVANTLSDFPAKNIILMRRKKLGFFGNIILLSQ
jgi:hypothetical protein